MVAKFLYRKSDNRFIGGGFFDVQPPDADHAVVEFADADLPDLRLHRYDAQNGKRLATAQELAAHDTETADAVVDQQYHDDALLSALLAALPSIVADIVADTHRPDLWRQQVMGRIKLHRRHRS